jgi:uncharacterized protein
MENAPLASDRIRFLDALRGIAILCIFIANIAYFSGFLFVPPKYRLPWATLPSDEIIDFAFFALIDGKFYTIFSLLFGIGCAMQHHAHVRRNLPFKPFFRRRMFWLLVIGLTHLCFIWLGDILTLYALLGFVLLLFIDMPSKRLLQWAVFLILVPPILNDFIIHLLKWDYVTLADQCNKAVSAQLGIAHPTNMGAYLKNEDWAVFFKTNLSNVFMRIERILYDGRPFKVLGIFLIGLWTGRKILTENLLHNTPLLRKLAIYGIAIGLPLSVFRTYIEFYKHTDIWHFARAVAYAFGTVPLAIGYAAALALQYRKKSAFMVLFEPVGKMALTNYLMQTLLSITIFYGIGFGLAGKFGFTVVLGIALLVYIFQIIFSALWLSKFRQGPAEWFWRWATNSKSGSL